MIKIKLYDVPRNTTIVVAEKDVRIPPASLSVAKGDILTFKRIDGMYSLCVDKNNNAVHIAAWTEVFIEEKK